RSAPILGIKIGGFSVYTDLFYNGVHNDYLQLLCETGIVGIVIFVLCNIGVFFKTITLLKSIIYNKNTFLCNLLLYSFMFQVFFLTYSITGLPRFDYEINIIYLICCGIPFGCDYYINGKGRSS
ncbi:MAG: hypothetical protein SPE99_13815, partial [Blautia sp.]|nr:hypothetical protein [Blautia sp.]